jgi:hypothetical protein
MPVSRLDAGTTAFKTIAVALQGLARANLDNLKERAVAHLIPQVLVQIRVRDLLQRLNVVHRQQVRVQVHELDAHLLKRPLGE